MVLLHQQAVTCSDRQPGKPEPVAAHCWNRKVIIKVYMVSLFFPVRHVKWGRFLLVVILMHVNLSPSSGQTFFFMHDQNEPKFTKQEHQIRVLCSYAFMIVYKKQSQFQPCDFQCLILLALTERIQEAA